MLLLSQTPNYALAALHGKDIAAMTRLFQCRVADSFRTAANHDIDSTIRKAVVTHGGTLIEPTSGWGPLETQLSLIGVSASGATVADAGRQWVKAVSRITAQTAAS